MIEVRSYADAETHTVDAGPNGRFTITNIVGRQGQVSDSPQCFIANIPEGGSVKPHFHVVDQFQLFTVGRGKNGPDPVAPNTLHYADRFTAYGPIVPDEGEIQYMTIRMRGDPGPKLMPASRAEKKPNGRLFYADIPNPTSAAARVESTTLVETQDDELGVFLLRAPGHSLVDAGEIQASGQRLCIVLSGDFEYSGRSHPRHSIISLTRNEVFPTIKAGGDGLHLVILQFPNRQD